MKNDDLLKEFFCCHFSRDCKFYLPFYNQDEKVFELVSRSGDVFLRVPKIKGLPFKKCKKIFLCIVSSIDYDACNLINKKIFNELFCVDEIMQDIDNLKFDYPITIDNRLIIYSSLSVVERF